MKMGISKECVLKFMYTLISEINFQWNTISKFLVF